MEIVDIAASKILVVDDDEFSRDLLMSYLRKEGFTQVESAENGAQALEMLHTREFALVLLDIEMPELDGVSALDRMKSDLQLRDIPVIMISGVDEIDSVVQCIALGAEDHLSKPFNPTLLRARVNASLEKKRLRDKQRAHLDQIRSQKRRLDGLLNVILPSAAASELKATGDVKPRRYDNVAVLFCDIVGFTEFCDKHNPEEVVSYLQQIIEKFEALADKHKMEKIKTIGDCFMGTAGLLRPNQTPLLSAVKCGLDMIAAARELNTDVRVGIHSGPVVAGIVGRDKYQFDVWGDIVNVAARMTGVGMPSTVTMAYEAWLQVEEDCKARMVGNVLLKGKGKVQVVEVYALKPTAAKECDHGL